MRLYYVTLPISSISLTMLFFGLINSTFGQINETSKIYENAQIGIKFQYPSQWGNPSNYCPPDIDIFCRPVFLLSPNGTMTLEELHDRALLLNMHDIELRIDELNKLSNSTKGCNCSTLKDYLVWDYSNVSHEDEKFINDNRTIIGKNYSAWQVEQMSGQGGFVRKQVLVYAINGNLGYRFFYDSPPDMFDKHLKEFKDMLNTVTFTVPKTIPEKKPSFLNGNESINSGN